MKNLLYIAGGAVGGWLIARRIFGPSASIRRNALLPYELNWLDDAGEPSKIESDVLVEGKAVGSIVMLTPKKWTAYDEKLMPIGEFQNSAAAAKASYNKWSDVQFWQSIAGAPEKPKAPKPKPKPKPKTPKPKGPYEIDWASKIEADIRAGNKSIGSITMVDPGNWLAYEGTQIEPFAVGISSGKKAAEKVYKRFMGLRDLPEPTIIDVKVPDWVTDIEVEPAVGRAGERFIVWIGDDRGGVIERRGSLYDAYINTKWGTKQLEIGVSRKRAIQAVYVAWKILDYLPRQTTRGKGVSYSPKRFKTLPPKKRGQRPRKVEQFRHKRHFVQKSAFAMSHDLNIPEKEIILYGKKLAEMLLIYGIVGKERQKTSKEVERSEKVIPPYKHFPLERRKRRTIVQKRLPRIRTKRVYRFAMVGPQGEVGFGAG
jgi:hypothetical protein